MKKQYNVVVTERKSAARSKRLRESGQGTSGTVVSVMGGDAGSSGGNIGDGHTHENLSTLNRIKTDEEDYLTLRTPVLDEETGAVETGDRRVKAGYADEAGHAAKADNATHADKAHDVDDDSPVYDRFLRKDVADEAAEIITFLKGLFVGRKGHGISVDDAGTVTAIFDELKNIFSIESPGFVSGDLGTGYVLKQDPESGESYLEVDRMLVRKLAYFVELVIKRLSYVGGEIILTPASMKCTKVEELATCYRCYFEQDDGQKSIKQEFRAGDQARAQTFNIKEGTSHHASNKYYWRLVEAVGINYIDLSKTDCDAGSGLPEAGDEIVQLGNRTDATRQNAIILSTVGDDAPSIKQYKGINAYALAGKEVTILSPTLNKIIGEFVSEATGKSFDEIIHTVQVDLGLIKEQTDKEYTIWFFEYAPTLTNIPASDWTTDELKALHEQDIFYNRDSGLAYRFVKSGSTWEWAEITDQQTLKALENAAKAQDTADSKRRVFVARPTKEDAYDVGDMWVNATYGELYDNDSLVCRTAKAAGEDFSILHWKPASNATTAYIKNLGDSILLQVSNSMDEMSGLITQNQESTNEAIREAEEAISKAASAASDAMAKAQEGVDGASSAMNKALEAFDKAGTAQESADEANGEIEKNAAAIQVTDKKITALAAKVTFDASGNITNINKSGLVTTDDMNSLITEKFTFDASGNITNINKSGLVTTDDMNSLITEKFSFDDSGNITNISTAGLVTEDDFAGLFATRMTAEGLVKKADISTFITEDDAGELISNAVISADQIRFNGNIVANDTLVVDKEGNLTLNNITANNGTFSGNLTATSIRMNKVQVRLTDGALIYGEGSYVAPELAPGEIYRVEWASVFSTRLLVQLTLTAENERVVIQNGTVIDQSSSLTISISGSVGLIIGVGGTDLTTWLVFKHAPYQ